MKTIWLMTCAVLPALMLSCRDKEKYEKGFSVRESFDIEEEQSEAGLQAGPLKVVTRPGSVLLTGIPEHRLVPMYMINYRKDSTIFTGSNSFHGNYDAPDMTTGNQWNYNFMPGLEAAYGFNMLNVSHYNNQMHHEKLFFQKPVLIKTIYYPTMSSDTLNYEPVSRNYYLVSAYDDDSNKDGFINIKDLRRFYFFDANVDSTVALIPKNYSVLSSQYDRGNDFMYVFAQLDQNGNGQRDDLEAIHVFWIDLKNPLHNGRQY